MPTETHRFATDGPIGLRVRNGRGSVLVTAADTTETLVEVSGRHDVASVRVAATDDGRQVSVEVPRTWRPGGPPRFDITVSVPIGSSVDLGAASATITTRGVLATVDAKSASGTISIEQADGDCRAHSASGDVELGTIGGAVTLKSASGDLRCARVGGRCSVRTASGSVDIGWAGDLVTATSASGAITVRDVARGEVTCKTSSGDVAIGVRKGTLVWLDLATSSGRTITNLRPEDAPATGKEQALRVRAHTASGDITISPSGAGAAAA